MSQVRLADGVQTRLPATWAAWRAGKLDAYKAGQIFDASERLIDPDKRADFDVEAAGRAVEKTAPQLSCWLARKVAKEEPGETAARHSRAMRARRIAVQLDLDGMGSLWASTNALDT